MANESAPDRYQPMQYRRCGMSGLLLPAISLGAWENVGALSNLEFCREELTEIDRLTKQAP